MKMTIKTRLGGLVLVMASLFFASSAGATAFFDVKKLLGEHFKTSDKVVFRRLSLSPAEQATLERRLGRKLPKREYVLFVATTGAQVDGYALIDDERGQHEMITFAAFFDTAGRITRQEVIAYREPYGDEVRQERFRKQFYGRSAASGFRLGKDIDSVSGATISAGAMCTGVHRATLLVELLRQKVREAGSLASL